MRATPLKLFSFLGLSLLIFSCDSSTGPTTTIDGGNTDKNSKAGEIAAPCGILTLSQIQAAVGQTITDQKRDTVSDLYTCYYGTDYSLTEGTQNLFLGIRTDKSMLDNGLTLKAADRYNEFHNAVVAGKNKTLSPTQYVTHLDGADTDVTIEDISGLGSSAFFYYADKPEVQLWILKGYVEINVLISLSAKDAGHEKERLKTIAEQFLAAIP